MIVNVMENELVLKMAIVQEKLDLTAKCVKKPSLKTLKTGCKVNAK